MTDTIETERLHAVNDDGSLNFVSPSQVALFDPDTKEGCPRKWWFNKVKRIRDRTDTGARNTGRALHTEVERYLKLGVTPGNTVVAAAMQAWFPGGLTLGTFAVEKAVNLDYRLAGLPVNGRMDLVIRDAHGLRVLDNKTCGTFQYVKKPEALKSNSQLIIYAHSEGPTEPTQLGHLYYCTRPDELGPRTLPYRRVDVQVSVVEIESEVRRLESVVESMKSVATVRTQKDVPVNRKACWAFGGCPYRSVCDMSDVTPKSPVLPPALVALSGPRKNSTHVAAKINPLGIDISTIDAGPVVPVTTKTVAYEAPAPESTQVTSGAELVLYVGCTPVIGPHATEVRSIEVVLAPYVEAVCQEYGVKDLRLIKYSEGFGALAALLRDNPPTGHITMDRTGNLSTTALEALLPLATAVVRATA